MSGLSGLCYDDLEIGAGAAQLRLQQVRQFRARLACRRTQSQMRDPVLFVVAEQWCDQQDRLRNQLGVMPLFLFAASLPRPKKQKHYAQVVSEAILLIAPLFGNDEK